MNWKRPNHSYEIQILKNMINMFEDHTEMEEKFTHNDKQFVYEVARWVQTRPTQCFGYDSKTKCGRPTVPERNGDRRIGSVCYECRQKAWEENPPSLSKREQRSMDLIEAVFKEQQKAILPTNEEQKVFRKKFNTFLAKIKGKDLMLFYYDQLVKKYVTPINQEEETI
jgi:hypothetical protein